MGKGWRKLGSWSQHYSGSDISGELTSFFSLPKRGLCLTQERRSQGLALAWQLVLLRTCPRQEHRTSPPHGKTGLPHHCLGSLPLPRQMLSQAISHLLRCSHLLDSCLKRQKQLVENKMLDENVLLQDARPNMLQCFAHTGHSRSRCE